MNLTPNAEHILRLRYLRKNKEGEIIESPQQMLERVTEYVGSDYDLHTRQEFYDMMNRLDFLPNSPCLFNAGTVYPQLAACFVLPVGDSIESIFTSLHQAAVIAKMGGGVGFNFSNLRGKGSIVRTTMGTASGPLSFMKLYNTMADVISQGGRRRLAQMAVLDCRHPDIREFVNAKLDNGRYTNFNFSVLVDDAFMEASPELFDEIVYSAWSCGEPGLLFKERLNEDNPTPHLGEIVATNPCAESPLLPYEACNLGSINLANMVRGGTIDVERLTNTINFAVKFLDAVVDRSVYPIPEIAQAVAKTRKIGLGVMGLADMFIKLGIIYGSEESFDLADTIMELISRIGWAESGRLGDRFGYFPALLDQNVEYNRMMDAPRRNATITSIAPTGTLSLIANCSSGIEPIFSQSYIRHTFQGSMECVHPISNTEVFVTAHDLKPEKHVKMQAIFQKHTDLGVSKTVNLPENAEIDDVARIFRLAHMLKCKGITVYRDNSRNTQVLYRN
jgi:ribonucleoside-diphosphate reductase alpha chain